MSYSVGPAKLALVEFDGRGVNMSAFESRIDLVLALMGTGAIGGKGFGSCEHRARLTDIENRLAEVRAQIRQNDADDFAREFLAEMTSDVISQVPPHLRETRPTYQTFENRERIIPHILTMLDQGWNPHPDDVGLIASGDQDEADKKFENIPGYAQLSETLNDIHDNGEAVGES